MPSAASPRTALITVAVATLDRPAGIVRCLDAIATGTVQPAEIVIVDQSASDVTERILADRTTNVPGLILVRQARRGLSASRNRAIRESSQPVIAFTDDDCVPDGRWIEAIERVMCDTSLAAVTGAVLDLGPDPHVPGSVPSSLRRGSVSRRFRRRALPWKVGTGGNMAVRREWLERVGPFDESLGAGSPGQAAEDMDMIHRLLRCGAIIGFDPGMQVRHARHSPAARRASRSTYGYGMGAFCAKWIRAGDPFAWVIWARWLVGRARVAAGGVRHRRWNDVQEQALYIRGAARGFVQGSGHRRR